MQIFRILNANDPAVTCIARSLEAVIWEKIWRPAKGWRSTSRSRLRKNKHRLFDRELDRPWWDQKSDLDFNGDETLVDEYSDWRIVKIYQISSKRWRYGTFLIIKQFLLYFLIHILILFIFYYFYYLLLYSYIIYIFLLIPFY